jgi:hypothetical protein
MKTSRRLTPLAALLTAFLLSGCGTSGLVTDGSCKIFKPISSSTRDTTQTRREVVAHNRVYGAVCKGT